jgi:hypothetical protein
MVVSGDRKGFGEETPYIKYFNEIKIGCPTPSWALILILNNLKNIKKYKN